MADYALCCCSTADVSEELLQSRDIKYVYFNYELNGEQCKDDFGRTNTPADLYRKMLEGQSCRTSQISVGQYMSFWKPFLEAGQDVFHLTLSSGISGSYESAVSAREELKKNSQIVRLWWLILCRHLRVTVCLLTRLPTNATRVLRSKSWKRGRWRIASVFMRGSSRQILRFLFEGSYFQGRGASRRHVEYLPCDGC